MTFAVGYRLMDGEPDLFSDLVREMRTHIREVYFAWPNEASGRAPIEPEHVNQVGCELSEIRSLGCNLNLLLNASCYGEHALSQSLRDHARKLVGRLHDRLGLAVVTTMSPLLARTVKEGFPEIDVRASINMRLGTVQAMQYVAPWFDSYNVQREYNRNPQRLGELRAWADTHGKELHILANSGCLNFCSAQTFHDNAVAHEAEMNTHANVSDLTTLCREVYADPERWSHVLRGSWIRPEDIARHSALVRCGYKLATRMHDRPRMVIQAYASGRHHGNLLDLMEPGLGPSFYPFIVDNRRFPPDWFQQSTRCGQDCARCAYCADVLRQVLVNVEAPATSAPDHSSFREPQSAPTSVTRSDRQQ